MSHSVVLFFMVLVGIYITPGTGVTCNWNPGLCFGNQNDLLTLSKCNPLIPFPEQNIDGIKPPEECPPFQTCCVDCNILQPNCTFGVARGPTADPPGFPKPCCPSELVLYPLSGSTWCNCCIRCKPNRRCRNRGNRKSRCITEEDPTYNFDWCLKHGGKIIPKLCEPEGCACCRYYNP